MIVELVSIAHALREQVRARSAAASELKAADRVQAVAQPLAKLRAGAAYFLEIRKPLAQLTKLPGVRVCSQIFPLPEKRQTKPSPDKNSDL